MDKNLSKAEETAVLLFDGMSKAEIEVRLAIANYLIPRIAGTPAAREAFNALVGRFQISGALPAPQAAHSPADRT